MKKSHWFVTFLTRITADQKTQRVRSHFPIFLSVFIQWNLFDYLKHGNVTETEEMCSSSRHVCLRVFMCVGACVCVWVWVWACVCVLPLSKWGYKVKAAVDPVILDVLPVHPTFIPEVLFKLLVDVVCYRSPATKHKHTPFTAWLF